MEGSASPRNPKVASRSRSRGVGDLARRVALERGPGVLGRHPVAVVLHPDKRPGPRARTRRRCASRQRPGRSRPAPSPRPPAARSPRRRRSGWPPGLAGCGPWPFRMVARGGRGLPEDPRSSGRTAGRSGRGPGMPVPFLIDMARPRSKTDAQPLPKRGCSRFTSALDRSGIAHPFLSASATTAPTAWWASRKGTPARHEVVGQVGRQQRRDPRRRPRSAPG